MSLRSNQGVTLTSVFLLLACASPGDDAPDGGDLGEDSISSEGPGTQTSAPDSGASTEASSDSGTGASQSESESGEGGDTGESGAGETNSSAGDDAGDAGDTDSATDDTSSSAEDGDGGDGGGEADTSTPLEPGPSLGAYQHTYYWVSVEDDFDGSPSAPVYDAQCGVLATVKPDFAAAMQLEGTGLLSDGRLLNILGGCACPTGYCFFEADEDHPWGYGVEGRALRPFRSIAVDTSLLTIGQAYYLPDFDGLQMPGDSSYGAFTHDGCVVADDIGYGIEGAHIDFFAALREHYLELVPQTGSGTIEVREGGELCAWLAD